MCIHTTVVFSNWLIDNIWDVKPEDLDSVSPGITFKSTGFTWTRLSDSSRSWLTLLTLAGGTLCPPRHIFAYNWANTHTSVLKKTFPNYEFRKGQYAFYPIKLSRFAEKNKVHQKYLNSIRGGPLQTESRPNFFLFKCQVLFWRFLGIQTLWILLNKVNHSLVSDFQKKLEP